MPYTADENKLFLNTIKYSKLRNDEEVVMSARRAHIATYCGCSLFTLFQREYEQVFQSAMDDFLGCCVSFIDEHEELEDFLELDIDDQLELILTDNECAKLGVYNCICTRD